MSENSCEQVGHQPLEPPGLGADDLGGALLRVATFDRAVGDRLGVPADRRERRPQIVRHAEQEPTLESPRRLELCRHAVECARQPRQLVVGVFAEVDSSGEVSGRDPVCGVSHRGERPRQPAREIERDDCGDGERQRSGEQEEGAGAAERLRLDLLGEDHDRRVPVHDVERRGHERGAAVTPALLLAGEERLCVEILGTEARGQVGETGLRPLVPEKRRDAFLHRTRRGHLHDAHVGGAQRVRDDRPQVPSQPALGGRLPGGGVERTERREALDGVAHRRRLRSQVVEGGIGGGLAEERSRAGRAEDEHAERDREHRDEQAGAEAACGRLQRRLPRARGHDSSR